MLNENEISEIALFLIVIFSIKFWCVLDYVKIKLNRKDVLKNVENAERKTKILMHKLNKLK